MSKASPAASMLIEATSRVGVQIQSLRMIKPMRWYVVFVKNRYVLHRYLVEYEAVDDFENEKEYAKWFAQMRTYFIERTGFKTARIVAIEPADLTQVFTYKQQTSGRKRG